MSHHSWFGSLLMVGNCFRMRFGEKQAGNVVRMLRVDCGAKKSIFSEVFFTLHKFVPRAARFPFQLVFLGCLDASLDASLG